MRSNRDQCWRKAAPREEFSSKSQWRAARASAHPLAHASLSSEARDIQEMMGIKGIVAGKVSCSCCQPHPHHLLVLPARDSGCTWSLKVHKVRIPQGAGDQPGHSRRALACQCRTDTATTTTALYFPAAGMSNLSQTGELFPESATQEHATSLLKQPLASAHSCACVPDLPGAAPRSDRLPSLGQGRAGSRCAGSKTTEQSPSLATEGCL